MNMNKLKLIDYCPDFNQIDGWLAMDEAQHLFSLARETLKGSIVEIGSYRGRSTVALGLGSLVGNKSPVYAIEPHEIFKGQLGGEFGPNDKVYFFNNIIKYSLQSIVRLINLSSEIVSVGWKIPISLLWIDGDHRYEAVYRDFYCWEQYLEVNAKIVFDDAKNVNLGSTIFIKELLNTKRYKVIHQIGKTVTLQKNF